MANYVAGGPGRALLFRAGQLYSVGNTLGSNAIHFSITAEDIRGGAKNILLAQYFHDPSMSIDLTNVFFNFEDLALTTGNTIEMGGLSLKEEQVSVVAGGKATPTEAPVVAPYMGASITIWYKKPLDDEWKSATYTTDSITIPGAIAGDVYCLKYFWNNENAKSMTLNAAYEPEEVELVLIQDLYHVEMKGGENVPGGLAGHNITICPRYKLNGTTDLDFSAGSVVGTSLSGNVLAVEDVNSCDGKQIFGYMTQEINGVDWRKEAVALAATNSEIELVTDEAEAIDMRVVFGGGIAAQKKDNNNFTFTSEDAGIASVDSTTGVVKGVATGTTTIEVNLTGSNVAPCFVTVTVS